MSATTLPTLSPLHPSTDLLGKVALVAGGAGLSEGVVASLLDSGAEVVVASPCAERRESWMAVSHPRLHVWALCLATRHGALRARRRIQRTFGRLDLVVAGFGSWPTPEELDKGALWQRDPDVEAHYALARTLMPLMAEQPGAQYLLVNDTNIGASASATGRLLLKDALAAEGLELGVGVHTAVLMDGAPVSGAEVGQLAARLSLGVSTHSRTFRFGAPRLRSGFTPRRLAA